jgi:hypothetical protein
MRLDVWVIKRKVIIRADSIIDERDMNPVFSRLSRLEILALFADDPGPDMFTKKQSWMYRLEPLLAYLDRVLRPEASVVVDNWGFEEWTSDVFEKLLSGRCRFQRLRGRQRTIRGSRDIRMEMEANPFFTVWGGNCAF